MTGYKVTTDTAPAERLAEATDTDPPDVPEESTHSDPTEAAWAADEAMRQAGAGNVTVEVEHTYDEDDNPDGGSPEALSTKSKAAPAKKSE